MVAWAVMPAGNLRIIRGTPATINSSGDSFRRVCSQRGAGLFYVNDTFLPGLVDVQSVTLDEPSAFAPGAQVQTAGQPAWAAHIHRACCIPPLSRNGLKGPPTAQILTPRPESFTQPPLGKPQINQAPIPSGHI